MFFIIVHHLISVISGSDKKRQKMMQSLKIFFEIYSAYVLSFSALLVPVIAISTTYIAYQQYRIEKQRVRMELYEKRYRIYKKIMEFIEIEHVTLIFKKYLKIV